MRRAAAAVCRRGDVIGGCKEGDAVVGDVGKETITPVGVSGTTQNPPCPSGTRVKIGEIRDIYLWLRVFIYARCRYMTQT